MAKAQILVVQDESIVAMDIRNRLKGLGYAVPAVVSSAEEAIKKAAERHPDLVLMDIALKGEMDGVEAAEQFRARFNIPVVYLTAYADEDTFQRAKIAEPFGYILKPFEEEELRAVIEMALHKHKLETALRESEWHYRLLAENVSDVIWTTDMNLQPTYISPSVSQLRGYSVEEAMAQTIAERLTPASLEVAMEVFAEARASGRLDAVEQKGLSGSRTLELEFTCKDGSTVWTEVKMTLLRDSDGRPTGILGVTRDITKRKQAGEALRESEEKYRELVENINNIIYAVDKNGVLTYISPTIESFIGYSPSEMIGRHFRELIYQEDLPRLKQSFQSILCGHSTANEYRVLTKRGEMRWMHTSSRPVFMGNGVIGVQGVLTDITEHKKAEEVLHQYAAELEARNEELDAFAYTVAHDLKHLLAMIIGYSEVLIRACPTMPEQKLRQFLQAIVWNGQKMNDIIEALLLLARVRKMEVEMRPLDMADIVAKAQRRLAYIVEHHQAEITLPNTWPMALGYGPWVEEVWANYLSNAIKYGGQPPRVELGATVQSDGMVRFWVRDNGPGISPEDQARLFTPFPQLKQVRPQEDGLGLSTAQRIVEKLGGQVGVESEVGQGSVFSFTLPGVTNEARAE